MRSTATIALHCELFNFCPPLSGEEYWQDYFTFLYLPILACKINQFNKKQTI